jgi:hypothetical protein
VEIVVLFLIMLVIFSVILIATIVTMHRVITSTVKRKFDLVGEEADKEANIIQLTLFIVPESPIVQAWRTMRLPILFISILGAGVLIIATGGVITIIINALVLCLWNGASSLYECLVVRAIDSENAKVRFEKLHSHGYLKVTTMINVVTYSVISLTFSLVMGLDSPVIQSWVLAAIGFVVIYVVIWFLLNHPLRRVKNWAKDKLKPKARPTFRPAI